MNPEKPAWIDVQALMPQVSVQQIAAYYRFALSESFGTSGEQRMRCPVASCDGHSDDRSVSVDVGNPKGLWKCHRKSYGCGAQGDKLTLMYCMKHGQMPPGGGQPKGKQFREIAEDLATIAGGGTPPTPPGRRKRGRRKRGQAHLVGSQKRGKGYMRLSPLAFSLGSVKTTW